MSTRTAASNQSNGPHVLEAHEAEPVIVKGGGGKDVNGSCSAPASSSSPLTASGTSTSNVGQDSLVHALAGGLGSAIALALTYPLDQIRTFQQVADDEDEYEALLNNGQCQAQHGLALLFRPWRRILALIEKHGIGSLYRGIIPVIISMGISNYVYFFISNFLKTILSRYRQKTGFNLGYFGHLAINTFAGVINVLVTTPLWVSSMRAKLSPGQGWDICAIMARVYRDEGIQALWSGTLPSLLLVINPVLQHFCYDAMKRHTLNIKRLSIASPASSGVGLSSIEAFIFGALAKTVATVVSYPLQVAQSRLRQQSEGRGDGYRSYTGTIDCLMHLFERKGWAGLYQGIETKLLQTVLTSAFMFLFYESIYRTTKRGLEFAAAAKRKR